MKKIMITGCNGQLGRAINCELEGSKEYICLNTDVADLDITQIQNVMQYVEEQKPYAIINCAAHTAVDACETDEDNAFRINALGPRNLSIAASKVNAKMIHISTDYVFSGDATKPYREMDKVDPQGVYGKTKLEGENYVKEFSQKYFILRTAWLYGEGKNFVKTMLRLAETNETVSVVGDQLGSPTSASELAKAIVSLLPTENYGIFHATCEGECSWADFAKEIFRLAKTGTHVNVITSDEFKAQAKRPAYSVLDNYMLRMTSGYTFQTWQTALEEYMNAK